LDFDPGRNNPNKRTFDDRGKREWEEQELRAKLRTEHEERRSREQGFRGNQRWENWDSRGKGKMPRAMRNFVSTAI
jgi:hypothetical protein